MADSAHRQRIEENAARLEALRQREQMQQLLQLDATTQGRTRVRAAERASGKEVDRASGKEIDRGGLHGAVAPEDILRLATGLGGHFVVAMISPVGSVRRPLRGRPLAQPTIPVDRLPGLFSEAYNGLQARLQEAQPSAGIKKPAAAAAKSAPQRRSAAATKAPGARKRRTPSRSAQ